MECSSPRDWDGLTESSWICFPHYSFSRLNSSVFFNPGFCDAVPVGFTFSALSEEPRVFPEVLPYSAQQSICPKGHLEKPVPPIPLPCPLLFVETQSSLGFRNVSMQHPYLGRWWQVLTSYRVILPWTELSVQPSWTAPFSGAVLSAQRSTNKNLVPLKIPSVCQVWLKLANWFKSY